jgi:hypothetical protein
MGASICPAGDRPSPLCLGPAKRNVNVRQPNDAQIQNPDSPKNQTRS